MANLPTLDDLQELAEGTSSRPDDRPEWLLPTCQIDNPAWLYYRFFHTLTKIVAPIKVIEVGTYQGGGAAHFACGNDEGHVVTIDIDPNAAIHTARLKLANVTQIIAASLDACALAAKYAPFDVCFIDAEHSLESMYTEYAAYRDLVRDGGLMFFDDVSLNHGMRTAWNLIVDPKVELPSLHFSGFGVCRKDASIIAAPWEQVRLIAQSLLATGG